MTGVGGTGVNVIVGVADWVGVADGDSVGDGVEVIGGVRVGGWCVDVSVRIACCVNKAAAVCPAWRVKST